ncbi:small multidrug resistance pump [Sphingobium faniae]|nr:small multidrug resistance pump [Sphingobium faniae]
MEFVYLAVAIACEVTATSFIGMSNGFTRLVPSLVTVVGYCLSFYFLSLALRSIPTGIAYAIWSGVGVVAITAIAWVFQGQKLDQAAIAGIALIIAGVIVIHTMSSFSH